MTNESSRGDSASSFDKNSNLSNYDFGGAWQPSELELLRRKARAKKSGVMALKFCRRFCSALLPT